MLEEPEAVVTALATAAAAAAAAVEGALRPRLGAMVLAAATTCAGVMEEAETAWRLSLGSSSVVPSSSGRGRLRGGFAGACCSTSVPLTAVEDGAVGGCVGEVVAVMKGCVADAAAVDVDVAAAAAAAASAAAAAAAVAVATAAMATIPTALHAFVTVCVSAVFEQPFWR